MCDDTRGGGKPPLFFEKNLFCCDNSPENPSDMG